MEVNSCCIYRGARGEVNIPKATIQREKNNCFSTYNTHEVISFKNREETIQKYDLIDGSNHAEV